jgi:hypothetical protein
MKTLMVTIAAAMMALNVAARNPGSGTDNYCVKSLNGKTVVEHNGITIKKEVTFKDGSCVKPDGTVILTNGKKYTLREGECVNSTSVLNLGKHRDEMWYKKEMKKPVKPETKKETPKRGDDELD